MSPIIVWNLARFSNPGLGSAPTEEVRYLTTCGGTNYGEGAQKVIVWRTKQHQIELFDFHLRNQELNDALTINFPRRVQVISQIVFTYAYLKFDNLLQESLPLIDWDFFISANQRLEFEVNRLCK